MSLRRYCLCKSKKCKHLVRDNGYSDHECDQTDFERCPIIDTLRAEARAEEAFDEAFEAANGVGDDWEREATEQPCWGDE